MPFLRSLEARLGNRRAYYTKKKFRNGSKVNPPGESSIKFNSSTAARGIGCVSSDGGETLRDLQIYISPESEHWLDCFHITMRLTVMGLMVKGADKASSTRARTCDSKFGALGKLRLTDSIMYRVARCRLACPQNCLLGSAIYHGQPGDEKSGTCAVAGSRVLGQGQRVHTIWGA